MTKPMLTRRRAIQTTAAAAGSMTWLAGHAQEKDTKEIKIGQSAHLTGPFAPTLVAVLKGQDMAIEEVNRKGGIAGRPIKLVALDDAYDPKRAVENTNKLIDEEKVVALFGYTNTAAVGGALAIVAEKKIPMIGPYTGSPSLRVKPHPYFFTTIASYRDEVVQMIRVLVSIQKTQLAVVYLNHPFGHLMMPVVESVAKELGANIVAKAAVDSTASDAMAAVHILAPAKPQAILLMAFGPPVVPIVKTLRGTLGVPLYALGIANSKSLVEALGDDGRGLAYTQMIPYPWRQTTPLTRDFAAAMSRANLPVDYDHFLGYVNTRVLIEGLKRAAPPGRPVTPASVTAGMEAIGKFDMGGYPLNFSAKNHHGSSFVEICVLGPNGRYMR